MTRTLATAAIAALISGSVAMTQAAYAQDSRYDHDSRYSQNSRYNHHRHTYRERDRNYRNRCSGGNGAVGTVAGAGGGALIGNALGGGVLGTVAGGVGGGLLGRTLDKNNTRAKNARNGNC